MASLNMSPVLTLIGRRKKSAIMHLSECLFRVVGGFLVRLFRVKIITYIELGFWKRFLSVKKELNFSVCKARLAST